uniref:hypothetical protein n=1 Tax=uncultured Holdemanella sp. TaxID=1763549 RepID=UPI0025E30B4E
WYNVKTIKKEYKKCQETVKPMTKNLKKMLLIMFLLIYNRVVDKMKVVYPFYESVIIKKPKKVNV